MKSGHVTEHLSEYMDGALSGALEERVKSHLIFCATCRETLREYQTQSGALSQMASPPPPPGLEQQILSAVRQEIAAIKNAEPRPRGFSFSFKPRWTWAAVGSLAAGALALWVGDFTLKSPTPPAENPAPMTTVQLVKTEMTPPSPSEPRPDLKNDVKEVPTPQIVEAAPLKEQTSQTINLASSYNSGGTKRGVTGTPQIQPVSINGASRNQVKPIEKQEFWSTSGVLSGFSSPENLLITDSTEFENIWKNHTENIPNPGPMPKIDFSRHAVAAIFAGEKPSAGYRVRLQGIETLDENGNISQVIHYQLLTPPPGSLTASVITQPFLFQEIPHTQEKVVFHQNP